MHLANHVKIFYTGTLSANRYYLISKDALRWTLTKSRPWIFSAWHIIEQSNEFRRLPNRKGEKRKRNLSLDNFHCCWYCSATQSCATLCDPMDCSTPGFPVLHHLPQPAQTHVHWVNDAFQPSHSFFLLPSTFPSIRVFSNDLALWIRWPKYGSFSISPTSEYSGLISFRIDWSACRSRVFSSTAIQKHQFFGVQSSLWSNSHIHTWLLEKPTHLVAQSCPTLWPHGL